MMPAPSLPFPPEQRLLLAKFSAFALSAGMTLTVISLESGAKDLLAVIWGPHLKIETIDYEPARAPFCAIASAVAFLAQLFPSRGTPNDRAADLGLQLLSGLVGLFAAMYWLSGATNDNAVKSIVALTPLGLIVAALVLVALVAALLRGNQLDLQTTPPSVTVKTQGLVMAPSDGQMETKVILSLADIQAVRLKCGNCDGSVAQSINDYEVPERCPLCDQFWNTAQLGIDALMRQLRRVSSAQDPDVLFQLEIDGGDAHPR